VCGLVVVVFQAEFKIYPRDFSKPYQRMSICLKGGKGWVGLPNYKTGYPNVIFAGDAGQISVWVLLSLCFPCICVCVFGTCMQPVDMLSQAWTITDESDDSNDRFFELLINVDDKKAAPLAKWIHVPTFYLHHLSPLADLCVCVSLSVGCN
jgi:hypothetical protein